MSRLEQVKRILADLGGKPVGDHDELGGRFDADGELGLDSLDKIQAAMAIEEAFGIEIPDRDIDDVSMGTPAGIAAYLDRRFRADEVEDDGFITHARAA